MRQNERRRMNTSKESTKDGIKKGEGSSVGGIDITSSVIEITDLLYPVHYLRVLTCIFYEILFTENIKF